MSILSSLAAGWLCGLGLAQKPTAVDPALRHASDPGPSTESLPKIDPALPLYSPADELTGTITLAGSDALNDILEATAREFIHHHPKTTFAIQEKGGATAPPRLLGDTISFGIMTRPYNAGELTAFVEKHGYEPTFLLVTWEVLAVWIHQDNPLISLTLPQLDAIFSDERKRGHPEDLTTWGQLGLGESWSGRPISLHGPTTASRVFGLFVRTALDRGRPRASCIEHRGSSMILQAVSEQVTAIGISSVRFCSAGVRAVPIVTQPGGKAAPPEFYHARNGNYPLAQPFYVVVNRKPGQQIDPVRAEFLRFLYSRSGQLIVANNGYTPLTAELAKAELQKTGLSP